MKLKYIKSLFLVSIFSSATFFTSCVGDLDVEPIDPSKQSKFVQDDVFAKIYATMALTGQEGPAGKGDVVGIDEGTSGFYRLIWNLSELPTDEAICGWSDTGISDMNFSRWSSSHNQIEGLYGRLYFDITLCNHFLEQTSGLTDEKSMKQIAEARFMRALNYYYLLDFFGNVPFTEVVSTTPPKQMKRADLYAYILGELQKIEPNMYDAQQAPYGRADKVANWLLQSKLYLNAEVYTGTPQWAKAAEFAKKVMDSSYGLASNYAQLFMGDNGENADARKEIIFPIRQDGIDIVTYAAGLFLIGSTHVSGMNAWGTTEGWAGNRGRLALAKKFFTDGNVPAFTPNTATVAGDDRALFSTYVEKDGSKTFESSLPIKEVEKFAQGLITTKFSNLYSTGKSPKDSKYTDMDIPLFRKAEAYLTYAEALLRSGGSKATALAAVNVLRTRAHATPLTDLTLDNILDERSREFYFEAQRRTDLIRYGYFTSSSYLWDWKGGVVGGAAVSSIYNLFPIPASDLNANENLVQNKGY